VGCGELTVSLSSLEAPRECRPGLRLARYSPGFGSSFKVNVHCRRNMDNRDTGGWTEELSRLVVS
jgi:hypothetical protein